MVLELKDVDARFGKFLAVAGVFLKVYEGEHVAIVGSNGSGKSTLLRTIMGLHKEWEGEILVDGAAMGKRAKDFYRTVAWIPQHQPRGNFPFTVNELLSSSGCYDYALRAARELGVFEYQQRPLSRLSGGQLQRAFLARALGMIYGGAKILLADEPTAALDFDAQEQVATMLCRLPIAMLIVTHDMKVAKSAHRTLEMAQGRIREISL